MTPNILCYLFPVIFSDKCQLCSQFLSYNYNLSSIPAYSCVEIHLVREGREVLRSPVLHHESAGHTVKGLTELLELSELSRLLYRSLSGGPALVADHGHLVPLRLLLQQTSWICQNISVHIKCVDLLHLPDVPRLAHHLLPQLLELLLLPLLDLNYLEVEHPAGSLVDVEDVEVLVLGSGQHDGERLPACHGTEERSESLYDRSLVRQRGDGWLSNEPVKEQGLGGGVVLVGEDRDVPDPVQCLGQVVGEGRSSTEGSLQSSVLRGLSSREGWGSVLYDVSHRVRGVLGGVLGVEVLLAPGGAPGGQVHDVGPGLTLLQVVDAGDGEGPGLSRALADPADHGVGGVAAVGHVEVVTGHQTEAVLGLHGRGHARNRLL